MCTGLRNLKRAEETFSNKEYRPSFFIRNTLSLFLLSRSLHSIAGPKRRGAQLNHHWLRGWACSCPASQWVSASLGQSLDWTIEDHWRPCVQIGSPTEAFPGMTNSSLGRSLSHISSHLRAFQFRTIFTERGEGRGTVWPLWYFIGRPRMPRGGVWFHTFPEVLRVCQGELCYLVRLGNLCTVLGT